MPGQPTDGRGPPPRLWLSVRVGVLRLFVMHAGWPLLDSMLALLYGRPNVYVDVAALESQTIVPREGYHRYLRALVCTP